MKIGLQENNQFLNKKNIFSSNIEVQKFRLDLDGIINKRIKNILKNRSLTIDDVSKTFDKALKGGDGTVNKHEGCCCR